MGNTIYSGSVVELKSGGLKMFVKSLLNDEAVCSWFVHGILSEHKFDVHQLKLS